MLNVCLFFSSQVQASWTIVGNLSSTVDALQVFESTFDELINKDYSIDVHIEINQGVLEQVI